MRFEDLGLHTFWGINMKAALVKSKTDWKKLKSGFGDVKLTREHPEADIRHITRGLVRQGLKPVPVAKVAGAVGVGSKG